MLFESCDDPIAIPSGASASVVSSGPRFLGRSLGIAEVLEILGYVDGERLVVGVFDRDESRSRRGKPTFLVSEYNHDSVVDFADRLLPGEPDDRCYYFGVCPTSAPMGQGGRRGTATQVTRLAAVWADLDEKQDGCGSAEMCWTLIDDLSQRLGEDPTVVIASGHGWQPIWVIEDGQILDSEGCIEGARQQDLFALSARFGRLVQRVAASRGVQVDGVFDLCRVLRMPGTWNCKPDYTEPAPTAAYLGGGGPMSVDYLRERLDEVGVPEREGDVTVVGCEEISPPSTWTPSSSMCRYAKGAVKSILAEIPEQGRHKWHYDTLVRLYAFCRWGCFTESERQSALTAVDERFTEVREMGIGGLSQQVRHGEIAENHRDAQAFVARMTDEHLAQREFATHPARHRRNGTECVQQVLGPVEPVVVRRSTAEQAQVLADATEVFISWLGDEYDLDAMLFTCAVAAAERLAGDPLWGLIVSGPGAAKTETAQTITDLPNVVAVSTISSEGALLSATASRDQTADATGGLLRQMGHRGVLLIKDVTSIISMDNRHSRPQVLAALREIYDGSWNRSVGVDGGKTLTWEGRIAVLGAVTTAWDRAHAVISSMGDRFVLLRVDSHSDAVRMAAGLRAIGNTGSEKAMRKALAAAVSDVVLGVDPAAAIDLTVEETHQLLAAANLVTKARTAVETDYGGNPIVANAPEMPTRFAKQLSQVVRGAVAIGVERGAAMALALRCARDSMPPLRLEIIEYLAAHPHSSTGDVRRHLRKPRTTVDRELQALAMLEVADCDEGTDPISNSKTWFYSLQDNINPKALHANWSRTQENP